MVEATVRTGFIATLLQALERALLLVPLLACLPAGAAVAGPPVIVIEPGQLPGDGTLPLIVFSADAPDGVIHDAALFAVDAAGHVGDPIALRVVAAPVPEPGTVLMLACGLVLMVPGGWLARWSRLGERESLLQRRLP